MNTRNGVLQAIHYGYYSLAAARARGPDFRERCDVSSSSNECIPTGARITLLAAGAASACRGAAVPLEGAAAADADAAAPTGASWMVAAAAAVAAFEGASAALSALNLASLWPAGIRARIGWMATLEHVFAAAAAVEDHTVSSDTVSRLRLRLVPAAFEPAKR